MKVGIFNISDESFISDVKVTKLDSHEDNVDYYRLSFCFNEQPIKEIVVDWLEKPSQITSIFRPTFNHDSHYDFSYHGIKGVTSSISRCAPFTVAKSIGNKAVLNVSLDEFLYSSQIDINVDEWNGIPHCFVVLLKNFTSHIDNYSVTLRIDRNVMDFDQSMKNVRDYLYKDINTYVPKGSYAPLYSTWYNFQRDVRQDALLEELKIAVKYGIKTVIIDDGWQLEDIAISGAGYEQAGDWKVCSNKFYDLAKFVSDCHAIGIKVMLWLAVPFIGYKTKAYDVFKGKYLRDDDGSCTAVYDPRYPELRKYFIDSCLKLVNDNKLDGLKLDFIDEFENRENIPYNHNMDYKIMEDAVKTLLEEIYSSLTKNNPDFLIEYRQNYTCPSLLKNANMIRVSDCPCDFVTNYTEIANLRMSTKAATHSDMLLYSLDEPIDQQARHLYATMFSVPQLSLFLNKLDKVSEQVLSSYMRFYNQYQDVLLFGDFKAFANEENYQYCQSIKNDICITAIYHPVVLSLANVNKNIVIKMTKQNIVLRLEENKNYDIVIYNALDEIIDRYSVSHSSFAEITKDGFNKIEINLNEK